MFDSYGDQGPLTVSLEALEEGKPAAVGPLARKTNDLPPNGRVVHFGKPRRN